MGAGAPYGFKKDENKKLKILNEEAVVVKEIFRLFLEEKRTTYEIGKILQNKEIVMPEVSSINNKKRKGDIRPIKTNIYFGGQDKSG